MNTSETHEFSKISEIDLAVPKTWQQPLFLTFDIDWVCDPVLADSIQLVESVDVAATWFITHETPLIQRLRDNPKFELGIHPNFNLLLQGDIRNGATAEEVVERLLQLVPDAKSVRSHSMTQSSRLLQLFAGKGLTHDCNHFIPIQSNLELKPWQLWNGMVKVPHFWEDDLACAYGKAVPTSTLVTQPGLKVFDFHPIHVFLNTEDLSRYERTRTIHRQPDQLIQARNPGEGTRTWLTSILETAQ